MAKVMQEMKRELSRLKYEVYRKRTSRLLDTAERKLKVVREKISEDIDSNAIAMTKLKVF